MSQRHEHDGDDQHRDPKRVRITHKQTDIRADLELTDDAVSHRAKLCDTPSSSSPSSHEIAPKLHVSSGAVEDAEMREASRMNLECRLTRKSVPLRRFQTQSWRSIELDSANKTLHRLLEEIPLESEAVTKSRRTQQHPRQASLQRSVRERSRCQDQRKMGAEAIQSTIRAEKLRRRREGRRRLRQHDDDSISEDATLASNGPQERKLHSVHSRRENRLSQRTHEGR